MGYSSLTEDDVVRPLTAKPLRRRRFGVPSRRRPASPSFESSSDDDHPRVTFQESENQVRYLEPQVSLLLADDEEATPQRKRELRQQLWYQKSDIQEFRRHAATISLQWRAGEDITTDETTRGLELRTSLDRQKRKQLILRRVLDVAQDCDYDDDARELAHVASCHSAHSRKVALAQAHRDYYSVYHPSLSSTLPDFDRLRCPTVLQDVGLKKRSCDSSQQPTGRRVRCRMW